MILCLDIGNSAVKAGVFDGRRLVRTGRLGAGGGGSLHQFIQGEVIERVGICSVVPERTAALVNVARARCPEPPLIVSAEIELPFEMAYETPETLGADRIAAAAGARALFPEADPIITIDAGTAVTVEVVAGGRFLGGSIGPGPELLHGALARGTAQLPVLTPEVPACAIGRSTEQSIRIGVMTPFIDGLQSLLRRFEEELGEEAFVVACGGWAEALADLIPEIDRTEPHLVLHGVRALVERNV